MPFHLYQIANSVHFVIVVAKTQITLMLAFGCEIDKHRSDTLIGPWRRET